VTIPRDASVVRAKTAQADARIDYSDLSQTLGVTVRDGGNGRLVADPTVTVAGQSFHGEVSARVNATSGAGITFVDPRVSAGGATLPDAVSQALAAVFAKAISLAGLPFNVKVTGVDVTSAGLVLHLSGSDLVYRRS
jgi:hypothetical protein